MRICFAPWLLQSLHCSVPTVSHLHYVSFSHSVSTISHFVSLNWEILPELLLTVHLGSLTCTVYMYS